MKSTTSVLIFILSIVTCTGCFDIFETVKMNKNGSGSYAIKFSLERTLKDIADYGTEHPESVSKEEEDNTALEEEDLVNYDAVMNEKKMVLEKIKGISKVLTDYDTSKFSFSISFEFTSLEALNEALATSNIFSTVENTPLPKGFKNFEWVEGKLLRHEDPNFKKSFSLPDSKKSPTADFKGLDMSMFLQDVTYNTTYTFDFPIKKYSNINSSFTENNKQITQTIYPFKSTSASTQNSLECIFDFGKNIKF